MYLNWEFTMSSLLMRSRKTEKDCLSETKYEPRSLFTSRYKKKNNRETYNIHDFETDISQPPNKQSQTISLKDIYCVCDSIQRGYELHDCIKIQQPSDQDSNEIAYLVVLGDKEHCESAASNYNMKMGNYGKFTSRVIDSFDGNGFDDPAFRLLALDFDTMFAGYTDKCDFDDATASKSSYGRLVNDVLDNIINVFSKTAFCGFNEYNNIQYGFSQINKLRSGKPIQENPHFSLAWDISGIPYNYDSEVVSGSDRFGFLRLERYDNGDKSKYDTGFMKIIYEMLKKDRSQAILLQIIVPDGRWIRGKKNKTIRYSDIQISLTAKGKVKTTETARQAICREFKEELGWVIEEDNVYAHGYFKTLFKADLCYINM